MSDIRLSPEAVTELAETTAWYAAQRPAFPRLLDTPANLAIRRALLPRFPFAVIFMELQFEVRVLAVAHTKRRPGYWLDRVLE